MRVKIDIQRFIGFVPVIFLAFFLTFPDVAFCDGNGYAFLIEKSPPAGGIVTPDVGLRQTSPDETVLLNATPKTGYRFLYWLGDVEDPTRTQTSVQVDSPKLIIAVFERVGYESPSGSSSGSSLIASGGGGGGGSLMGMISPSSEQPPYDPPDDPPDDPPYDPPPETPEPATILLFGLGFVMLKSKRAARKG